MAASTASVVTNSGVSDRPVVEILYIIVLSVILVINTLKHFFLFLFWMKPCCCCHVGCPYHVRSRHRRSQNNSMIVFYILVLHCAMNFPFIVLPCILYIIDWGMELQPLRWTFQNLRLGDLVKQMIIMNCIHSTPLTWQPYMSSLNLPRWEVSLLFSLNSQSLLY